MKNDVIFMIMNEDSNKPVAVKISCPFCGYVFREFSKLIYNIRLEEVDFELRKICPKCKMSINQRYWTEKGADGEIMLCIGNRDDLSHPVATSSGKITRSGILDPEGYELFEKQGIKLEIFKGLPEEIRDKINKL